MIELKNSFLISFEDKLAELISDFDEIHINVNERGNFQIDIWKKFFVPSKILSKLEGLKRLLKVHGYRGEEVTQGNNAGYSLELYEPESEIAFELNNLVGRVIRK